MLLCECLCVPLWFHLRTPKQDTIKLLRFTARDVQGDPRIVFQRLSEQVMKKIAALKNPREE